MLKQANEGATPMAVKHSKPHRALGLNKPHSKREDANKRNKTWQQLSPQEQLAEINIRLDENVGAGRQRARLNAMIRAGLSHEQWGKLSPAKKAELINRAA
jgi:hypothetical protein